MRPYRARFREQGAFFAFQSWAGCITNIFGFDLRQAQAQANMQLAFEFAQRLAAIRSSVQFPSVITEFTSRRIAMFQKHSTELTELSTSDGHPKTKIYDVRAATAHTHVLSVSQNVPALG